MEAFSQSNSALFGNIAYKLFWGEALTGTDYKDILQHIEDVLKTFQAESGPVTSIVLDPLKRIMDVLKPLLSDTAQFVADRVMQIISAITRAIDWLVSLIK